MGHWRTGGTAIGIFSLLGIAIEPAYGQISTMPPPPVMIPAPIAAPPSLETTPPPWAVQATPTGNPGEWVTSDDYPTKSLREGASGVTGFRVAIGTDGMVTGCNVTSSSGSQELDEATCRLVTQRARFVAARNAKGEPVLGQYSNRIRWTIPQGDPNFPIQIDPTVQNETFVVEIDGSASHCTATTNGVDSSNVGRNNPCLTGRKLVPFVDAAGHPVRRLVTINFVVSVTDPNAKPPPPRKKRRR